MSTPETAEPLFMECPQKADGMNDMGVRRYYAVPPMKSIGNSTTAPRDLVSETHRKAPGLIPIVLRGDDRGGIRLFHI
mgnify:CR=1 FL=1